MEKQQNDYYVVKIVKITVVWNVSLSSWNERRIRYVEYQLGEKHIVIKNKQKNKNKFIN